MRRFEWTVRCVIGLAVLICAVDVAGIAIGYVGRSPDPHSQPQTQTRTQPQARTPPPTEPQSRPGVLPQGRPSPAVTAFFSSYVDASGRVVRKDQGGDTVSEGQGYALLLAAAVGDRARFSSVWTWTKAHLQRQDGLLAWH